MNKDDILDIRRMATLLIYLNTQFGGPKLEGVNEIAVVLSDIANRNLDAPTWQEKAHTWLLEKAIYQETVNKNYPQYLTAYPNWKLRAEIFRSLSNEALEIA